MAFDWKTAVGPKRYPIGLITLPAVFNTVPVPLRILVLNPESSSLIASFLIWSFNFFISSKVKSCKFLAPLVGVVPPIFFTTKGSLP